LTGEYSRDRLEVLDERHLVCAAATGGQVPVTERSSRFRDGTLGEATLDGLAHQAAPWR
jgi:hypothetical protein